MGCDQEQAHRVGGRSQGLRALRDNMETRHLEMDLTCTAGGVVAMCFRSFPCKSCRSSKRKYTIACICELTLVRSRGPDQAERIVQLQTVDGCTSLNCELT